MNSKGGMSKKKALCFNMSRKEKIMKRPHRRNDANRKTIIQKSYALWEQFDESVNCMPNVKIGKSGVKPPCGEGEKKNQ